MIKGKLRPNPMHDCYPPPSQPLKPRGVEMIKGELCFIVDPDFLYEEFRELYKPCRHKTDGLKKWDQLTSDDKKSIIRWLRIYMNTADPKDIAKLPRPPMFIGERRWEQTDPLLTTGKKNLNPFRERKSYIKD